MTYSGVFERYPNLHVVCTEGYAGWLAFAMQFYDHHFSQSRLHQLGIDHLMGPAKIDVHPSYYLKRQTHATFMWDPLAIRNRDLTGLDCLMWGNDYPHHEGYLSLLRGVDTRSSSTKSRPTRSIRSVPRRCRRDLRIAV